MKSGVAKGPMTLRTVCLSSFCGRALLNEAHAHTRADRQFLVEMDALAADDKRVDALAL